MGNNQGVSAGRRRVGTCWLFIGLLVSFWGLGWVNAQPPPLVLGPTVLTKPYAGEWEAFGADLQNASALEALSRFCAGEADAALSLRPLSSQEKEDCAVPPVELLLGHRIAALYNNFDIPDACLDSQLLDTFFAPSATGQIPDWQQVDETLADPLPFQIWLPEATGFNYALLDEVVVGLGLRTDAAEYRDAAELAATFADESAVLALASVSSAPAAAQVLRLRGEASGVCLGPMVENVEAGSYPLARSVYLYVNRERMTDDALRALAEAAAAGEFSAPYIAPSAAAQEVNRKLIAEEEVSVVSAASEAFVMPAEVGGWLRFGGVAQLSGSLAALEETLSLEQPNLTINSEFRGGPAGERALCADEIDLLLSLRPLSESAGAQCAEADITIISWQPAAQAVVALANHKNAKMRCIDLDRWQEIWAPTIANGATVATETEVLPFAPAEGALATDLMMAAVSGKATPIRRDIEVSDDPLWRAAAVGVVENGLSYFSWEEYQQVLAAGQENVQTVRLGKDCIAPSEAEILAGNYPLAWPVFLHINSSALADKPLQTWLWFAFSGGNHALLAETGLVSQPGAMLRLDLLQSFEKAEDLKAAAELEEMEAGGDEESDEN